MRRRRPLKDLDKLMGAKRVARARAVARKKMQSMLIGEVRRRMGFTQSMVANAMGVSQSALSQLERQDDMQITTLRRLVSALGGELDVVARFGKRSVVLVSSRNR